MTRTTALLKPEIEFDPVIDTEFKYRIEHSIDDFAFEEAVVRDVVQADNTDRRSMMLDFQPLKLALVSVELLLGIPTEEVKGKKVEVLYEKDSLTIYGVRLPDGRAVADSIESKFIKEYNRFDKDSVRSLLFSRCLIEK